MQKIINCKDKYGNNYQLRVLKNDFISDIEILVPLNYRMIYSGAEWYGASHNGFDIEEHMMKEKGFRHQITIVNLNPKPLGFCCFNYENQDEDIELYKYIVSNCSIMNILLDKNNKLDDIIIKYEDNNGIMFDSRCNNEEVISFFDEDRAENYLVTNYFEGEDL